MLEVDIRKHIDLQQIGLTDQERELSDLWMAAPPPSAYAPSARIAQRGMDPQGLYYKGHRALDGSLMFSLQSSEEETFSVFPDTLMSLNYLDLTGLDTLRDFQSCTVGEQTLLDVLNTLGVFHIMDPSTNVIMAAHIESDTRDEIRVRCGRNSYVIRQFDEVSRMAGSNILLLASCNLLQQGKNLAETSKLVAKPENRTYIPPIQEFKQTQEVSPYQFTLTLLNEFERYYSKRAASGHTATLKDSFLGRDDLRLNFGIAVEEMEIFETLQTLLLQQGMKPIVENGNVAFVYNLKIPTEMAIDFRLQLQRFSEVFMKFLAQDERDTLSPFPLSIQSMDFSNFDFRAILRKYPKANGTFNLYLNKPTRKTR